VSLCVPLAGCFYIGSSDDWEQQMDARGQPRILATWTLESYYGEPASCPDRYDLAVLQEFRYSAAYPCADGRGTLELPLDYTGTVAPTIAITTVDRSSTFSVGRFGGGGIPDPAIVDFTIYTDAGYFKVAWLPCSYAGDMYITATSKTTPFHKTWTQNCSFGQLTQVVPLGDYTLTLDDGDIGGTDLTVSSLTDVVDVGEVKLHSIHL